VAQCLKYKTDQASDLKKVEKMNALCLTLMARGLSASAGACARIREMTRRVSLALACLISRPSRRF
jgi:hypothetical protein